MGLVVLLGAWGWAGCDVEGAEAELNTRIEQSDHMYTLRACQCATVNGQGRFMQWPAFDACVTTNDGSVSTIRASSADRLAVDVEWLDPTGFERLYWFVDETGAGTFYDEVACAEGMDEEDCGWRATDFETFTATDFEIETKTCQDAPLTAKGVHLSYGNETQDLPRYPAAQ